MNGATIRRFELREVDLPFRVKFKHAASERGTSHSIFLKCVTDNGVCGFGEGLPRTYVTGESQESAFDLLAGTILPRLVGRHFAGLEEVEVFLADCDGRAPTDWVDPAVPQGASWCCVDLALLDAFGRISARAAISGDSSHLPDGLRYSGVLSSEQGVKHDLLVLVHRLYHFRALKLKVDRETGVEQIRRIRRLAGKRIGLRVDVNMGWDLATALDRMPAYAEVGVESFEQPLAADDIAGLAHLVQKTGLDIMADESFQTAESLQTLIAQGACTSVNARISKCGGLIATLKRCRQAMDAGLGIQIGCQVGESSLLSAAHLRLCAAVPQTRYAEGCFGTFLLERDPVSPMLRFARGGRPPASPAGPGLGVNVDEAELDKCTTRSASIDAAGTVFHHYPRGGPQ